MKREEGWVKMATARVIEVIKEETQGEDPYENSLLIQNVIKNFIEYEARLEAREDESLSEKYNHRAELPIEQWVKVPKGMGIDEYYFSVYLKGDKDK